MTEKLLATLPAIMMGYSVFWIEHLRIERWLTHNPYRFGFIFLSNFAKEIPAGIIFKLFTFVS